MFHPVQDTHSASAVRSRRTTKSGELWYTRLDGPWLAAQSETDGEQSDEPQFWRDWEIVGEGLDVLQDEPEDPLDCAESAAAPGESGP